MLQVDLLSAPKRDEEPRPLGSLSSRVAGLSFGTALPGGFASCSFSIATSQSEAFEWYANRIGLGILVHEGGQSVWEGRISSASLQPFGIEVVAEGYWSDLVARNTFQWWGATGAKEWKEPSFDNLVTSAGLPAIPWSNFLFKTLSTGDGFYVAPEKGLFLEHDSSAFVYLLPVPPAGVDNKDFWAQPNMIRRIEAEVEIKNSVWDDNSATLMEVEVYTTPDPHAGTWTLEPVSIDFGEDTSDNEILFAEGFYTGDDALDRLIPVPFTPKMVVVKGDAAANGHAMLRSDTMDAARNLTNGSFDQGINGLASDGFRVDHLTSPNGRTNVSGVKYFWYAFGGNNIETGIYVGNGQAEKAVSTGFSSTSGGGPFPLGMVIVSNDHATNINFKIPEMVNPLDLSFSRTVAGFTDQIIRLNDPIGGFTVGAGDLNQSGLLRHYVAFKESINLYTGTYTGDTVDDRDLPLSPMESKPQVVHIKADAGQFSAFRTASMDEGESNLYGSSLQLTNEIQSFKVTSGQFQLGDAARVNAALEYYWFAIGDPSAKVINGSIKIDLTVFDVRGVMFRVNGGNDETKTYDGNTGDASVEINDVRLRNFHGDLSPGEIIKRAIGGADENSPLHEHLSTRTLFIKPTPESPLFSISYNGEFMQDVIEQLGKLADPKDLRAWFGAVWDSRMVHFEPRDISNVKWRISKRQLSDGGLTLERSIENFWSHVQSFFVDSRGVKQSEVVRSDPQFRENIPAIRRQVLDMGEIPLSTARDAFYEDFKVAQPAAEIDVNGLVMNAYGVLEPLWRIRAGDLFQIDDLFPGRYLKGTDAIDPLRTFLVRETEYNVDENILTLSPTWAPDRMDTLMANVEATIG